MTNRSYAVLATDRGPQRVVCKPIARWSDRRVALQLGRVRSPALPRCFGVTGIEVDGMPTLVPDPAPPWDAWVFEYIEGIPFRSVRVDDMTSYEMTLNFDAVVDALAWLMRCADMPFAHLDVSPENMIFTDDGALALIDFEEARFLSPDEGAAIPITGMTPGYAAPETLEGTAVPESDLYSLAMAFIAVRADKKATDLSDGAVRSYAKKWGAPLSDRLLLGIAHDPKERRRAVEGSLYHRVLEAWDVPARARRERARPMCDHPQRLNPERVAPARSTCPYALNDCPFMDVARSMARVPETPHVLQ
ncbi:MAG: protein kinase domain-containing protein [Saccharofermentanales bacterium]|jgi:serine/threonine protein kinase